MRVSRHYCWLEQGCVPDAPKGSGQAFCGAGRSGDPIKRSSNAQPSDPDRAETTRRDSSGPRWPRSLTSLLRGVSRETFPQRQARAGEGLCEGPEWWETLVLSSSRGPARSRAWLWWRSHVAGGAALPLAGSGSGLPTICQAAGTGARTC